MKKPGLLTVILIVLVDLLGFGIVLPLLPFYASQFHASPAAIGALYSVYSGSQLIFSPIWGGLSDRIGRRPVMLVSTLGASFSYLIFAFSGSLGMLFFARILAGVMGGNISAAQAYIADVTTPEDRARGMGLLGAAFGLGFMIGPGLAAALVQPGFPDFLQNCGLAGAADWARMNRYSLPGVVAAGLSFTSFALVLLKLPESNVNRGTPGAASARPSIFSHRFWGALRTPGARGHLPILLACVFLITFGQASLYSSFPLFCQARLGLAAHQAGFLFAWMGFIAVFVQGGLMRQLSKRFAETGLLFTGILLVAAGLALIPFSGSTAFLILATTVLAIGGSLAVPSVTSLVSKEAPDARTGATMGISQSMAGLGRVFGPAWGGAAFQISIFAPFLATAAIVCLAAAWARKIRA